MNIGRIALWSSISLFILLIVTLLGLWIFKPWGYVNNYELGYKFDARTGTISVLPHTGYNHRTPIFESIYAIDLRPRQVCLTVGMGGQSAGTATSGPASRVLNCKLVKFNPAGLSKFIEWHGANDYDGETLNDLLKIYAYADNGDSYPFLTIMGEVKGGKTVMLPGQTAPATVITDPAVAK